MKKYFLNVTYYDYRDNLLDGGYCIGEYDTLDDAMEVFASYSSINDFQGNSNNEYYVYASIDTDEQCGIRYKYFEEE